MKHLSHEFILQEIEYLDPELNDDHEFRRVRRRSQGPGIVVSSAPRPDDEEVTVAFAGKGVKKLMASFAGLTKR